MLMIIGGILLAVGGLFGLWLLISAFKQGGALQGLLSMFVPFYLLYFAFAKYQSPKKGLVVGSYLGATILGVILWSVGGVMMANDAAEALSADLATLEGTDFANPPAAGAADEAATIMSCNLSEQPGRLCNEYRVTASYTRENATEHCDMIQIVADEKLPLAEGGCPTENAIAKCEPRFGNNTTYYYRDDTPGIDQNAALSSMETLCVGTFTRL